MLTHALNRTSPTGSVFIGECPFCGLRGLTLANIGDPCTGGPMDQDARLLFVLEQDSLESDGAERSISGSRNISDGT